MRVLFVAYLLSLTLGCSSSKEPSVGIVSNYVMPINEYPGLSEVEVVLNIVDMEKPPSASSASVVKTLREFKVKAAVNLTYTLNDAGIIDVNILQFSSPEIAKASVLENSESFSKLEGVADAAIFLENDIFAFSYGELKFQFATSSETIDLISFGKKYAQWITRE